MRVGERIERSATVSRRGQVTLPAEVRRALGVGPHDRVAFVVEGATVRLHRTRAEIVARTAGSLQGYFPTVPLSAEKERQQFEEGVTQEATGRATRSRRPPFERNCWP